MSRPNLRVFAKARPSALPQPGNRDVQAFTKPQVLDRWSEDAAGIRALERGDNVITMFDVIGEDWWTGGGVAALTDPKAQGSPVSIYAAAVDPETGALIGEPDSRFIGELDDASFNVDKNSSLLELELATVWERLFDDNEGNRWNDTFWTYLFGANARAFEGITNVGEKTYWGYNGPSR